MHGMRNRVCAWCGGIEDDFMKEEEKKKENIKWGKQLSSIDGKKDNERNISED
jgi:hypothetical protein